MSNQSALRDDKVDKLIDEVEARPPLYKKSLKEYSDAVLKKKLWEEVNVAVVDNWGALAPNEKHTEGASIKKRWDNLRTCFARELRAQTSTKSGQAASKRRKYIYFDRLLFLLPEVEQRATVSNLSANENTENTENDVEEVGLNSDREDDDAEIRSVINQESSQNKQLLGSNRKKQKLSYEDELLSLLKNKGAAPVQDEETNFALSLVPSLKNLPEENKLRARIEILNVLQNFKYVQTVPSPLPSALSRLYQNQRPQQPSFDNYSNGPSPYQSSSMYNKGGSNNSDQSMSPSGDLTLCNLSPCSDQTVASYFSSYAEKTHPEGGHQSDV